MPRKKAVTAADPDAAALAGDRPLPGLADLKADPVPRKAAAKATGRPVGRPRTRTGPRTVAGRAMTQAEKVNKIRADLTSLGVLAASGIELRDPCAGVMFDVVDDKSGETRLEAIVERAVNILARNPKVLDRVADMGLLVELGGLASLVIPIGRTVWHFHGPGGMGHDEEPRERDASLYPARAAA
jgi:hypothetical protein